MDASIFKIFILLFLDTFGRFKLFGKDRVIHLSKSGLGYTRKVFMIKLERDYFSDCHLSRLDSSPARFRTKCTYHIARIMRGKSFFVDWFENSDWGFRRVLDNIGSTCAFSCQLGFLACFESFLNLLDLACKESLDFKFLGLNVGGK